MPAVAERARFTLAYSPCPNDTYIFAALTNGLLPGAPAVSVALEDVEALNQAAREGRFELTKVSYGAIPYLLDRYRILRAGGALGRGCGPLLIARPDASGAVPSLAGVPRTARIAIPGRLTTAYLLLRLALGFEPEIVELRFDGIVGAVARGDVDAGLIIHESRFTYARAGLGSIADLGDWWERTTGRPIPLGAILVRRDLADADSRRINAAIRESLAFARRNEAAVAPYVREHAFEMEDDVMRAHIALYVNEYSDDVGEAGAAAVGELFARAAQAGLTAHVQPEFAGSFAPPGAGLC
jgi:1,4-dihydroxy-6-naphthoate synthase